MSDNTYVAFCKHQLLAQGALKAVVQAAKEHADAHGAAGLLFFDEQSGRQLEFELQGSLAEVLSRLVDHPFVPAAQAQEAARTGPGRPRLGVVSREVSLLPRHWEWLDRQPGGVSGALRRLVDEERKRGQGKALSRQTRDAAGKIMWSLCGDLPAFEEASRALYAKDAARFLALSSSWPPDPRAYLVGLIRQATALEAEATPAAAEQRATR